MKTKLITKTAFTSVRHTRHGIIAYNHNDNIIGASLETYGEWAERELTGCLLKLIKPGDTVLDVGAHIGTHTLAFAQAVGPNGRVIALEPQPYAFRYLCANIVLNSLENIDCFQLAAGSKDGEAKIHWLPQNAPNNFGANRIENREDTVDVPVRIVAIDNLPLGACAAIKIDVEGMEQEVLDGAAETIKKHQPAIFVEQNEGSQPAIAWLMERGYKCHWFEVPMFSSDNYYGAKTDLHPGTGDINILALPPRIEASGIIPITDPSETWEKYRERVMHV